MTHFSHSSYSIVKQCSQQIQQSNININWKVIVETMTVPDPEYTGHMSYVQCYK